MGDLPLSVRHVMTTIGPKSFGLGPVGLNLVREQRARGIDARIWCLDTPDVVAWALRSVDLAPEYVVSFRPSGPAALMYSREMQAAAVGDEGRLVDVVHQHGIWQGASRVANRWRRRFGGPTVTAPHGSLEPWAIRRSRLKKHVARLWYENENLRDTACCHATSATEAEGFRQFGITAPIALVPNGLSETWLASEGSAERCRQSFGLPNDQRILLYVGRVTPVKNLEMLFRAMDRNRKLLSGWVLVIAGSDEFGYQGKLERLSAELGLVGFVRFVGFVSQEAKRDCFAAASAFVLPSIREASPIAVLEALGSGLPVLTTTGTPWQELRTHRCGWWADVSVEAMSQALAELLCSTPDTLTGMGFRARDLVRKHYTWAIAAAKLERLYSWLIRIGHRPDCLLK